MKPLRVLIACEYSGVVRDAFAVRGHDAWSADLLPSSRPGNHIQCEHDLHLFDIIAEGKWDMLIAHPECRFMANSGACRLYIGGKGSRIKDPDRWERMARATESFKALWNSDVAKIALENPVMHCHARKLIGTHWTQTVQPYEFGDPESKRTALWLKNLPPLKPTNVLPLPECGHWENQTPSGQNKLGPSPTRSLERARTYPGIAAAMAEQWGTLLT